MFGLVCNINIQCLFNNIPISIETRPLYRGVDIMQADSSNPNFNGAVLYLNFILKNVDTHLRKFITISRIGYAYTSFVLTLFPKDH